jgi:hypothetical protein
MIFTYYIRHGNFGYSKFTQQDNHYNLLVKQAQIDGYFIYLFLFYNLCHMTGLTHRASCSFTGNLKKS